MSAPVGLTVKTKIADASIGDCIPCRYKATSGVAGTFSEFGTCVATEIPYVGSATPDGLFYFTKSDTGLFIADRVIQTNISWEALNSAKFIQGNNNMVIRKIPFLTANNSDGCIADASTSGLQSEAYRAFDSDISSVGYCWQPTAGIAPPHWLSIKNKDAFSANTYSITCDSYDTFGAIRAPKNFKLQATLDNGITWVDLDTRSGVVWVAGERKVFSFLNYTKYAYYRLYITATGYTEAPWGCVIINFELGEASLIRSLTGGNSYLGTDGKKCLTNEGLGAFPPNNEWDTYIANSNLKGRITPGDDNVWHWDNTATTMCQDILLPGVQCSNGCPGGSTTRSMRGLSPSLTAVSGRVYGLRCINGDSTSILNEFYSFRPVLEYLETNLKATTLWY